LLGGKQCQSEQTHTGNDDSDARETNKQHTQFLDVSVIRRKPFVQKPVIEGTA
jgi:hypothetical protein